MRDKYETCKCKQKLAYSVHVYIDEDSLLEGWDGDGELDPDREWMPYQIVTYARCTRCGEHESIDALGAVWCSQDSEGDVHLKDMIMTHEMLPRHVSIDDVDFNRER